MPIAHTHVSIFFKGLFVCCFNQDISGSQSPYNPRGNQFEIARLKEDAMAQNEDNAHVYSCAIMKVINGNPLPVDLTLSLTDDIVVDLQGAVANNAAYPQASRYMGQDQNQDPQDYRNLVDPGTPTTNDSLRIQSGTNMLTPKFYIRTGQLYTASSLSGTYDLVDNANAGSVVKKLLNPGESLGFDFDLEPGAVLEVSQPGASAGTSVSFPNPDPSNSDPYGTSYCIVLSNVRQNGAGISAGNTVTDLFMYYDALASNDGRKFGFIQEHGAGSLTTIMVSGFPVVCNSIYSSDILTLNPK